MHAIKQFSREAVIGTGAFVILLLVVAFGGIVLGLRNHALGIEVENKTRVLNSLDRQPISSSANVTSLPMELTSISAPTETIAASKLQDLIVSSLDGIGGSVRSVQTEATTDTIGDGLRRLKAQIEFESSTTSLQKLLFNFETAVPFIFVDGISMQPGPVSAAGAPRGDAILRITLVASSYWKDASNHQRNH